MQRQCHQEHCTTDEPVDQVTPPIIPCGDRCDGHASQSQSPACDIRVFVRQFKPCPAQQHACADKRGSISEHGIKFLALCKDQQPASQHQYACHGDQKRICKPENQSEGRKDDTRAEHRIDRQSHHGAARTLFNDSGGRARDNPLFNKHFRISYRVHITLHERCS